ncbi:conjugal transfer protein TraO [Dryocola sp. BD626]|uniref:conjugal transfer protein TraO n=1 Tax=Dryocola sp. BD626 TaxID=3133273 RepID=UPI003F4F8515
MDAEKDVGRDVKKTGLVIGGLAFAVIAGGFLLATWLSAPPEQASKISVDKAANGTGTVTPESPQYSKVLRANNEDGANQAHQENASFIASVGTGGAREEPIMTPPPPPPPEPVQTVQQVNYVQQPAMDPDKKKALENLLTELMEQRKPATGQLASVAGGSATGQSGQAGGTETKGNVWAAWTDSLSPQTAAGEAGALATVAAQVLIPAGSRPGGVIETAVDSDNTRSQVLARIPSGPYAGATLLANGVQLAGDGVAINFNRMEWQGDTWNVDVWAAMPDTLQSSVASDVNNRYATRIILPAIASGLGLAGQLYASANTQILSNGYDNIEARTGMPDAKAVAGTIVGGAAQQAGQVIASDAQRLPVKQVLVYRGQTVALLFMTAVKTSDNVTRAAATAPIQR